MDKENSVPDKERLTELHYKDGSQVSYASHLHTSTWNREGTRVTKKSRKDFTCVFGCSIPKGSTYLSLEMMAGLGRADSCVSFALCEHHNKETEALIGNPVSSDIETSEILRSWLQLLN